MKARKCRHCLSVLHVVKGTLRHYGSIRACKKIQRLTKQIQELQEVAVLAPMRTNLAALERENDQLRDAAGRRPTDIF